MGGTETDFAAGVREMGKTSLSAFNTATYTLCVFELIDADWRRATSKQSPRPRSRNHHRGATPGITARRPSQTVADLVPAKRLSRRGVEHPPAEVATGVKAIARMMAQRDHDRDSGKSLPSERDSSSNSLEEEA
jgi:hypothetical protein